MNPRKSVIEVFLEFSRIVCGPNKGLLFFLIKRRAEIEQLYKEKRLAVTNKKILVLVL